MLNRAAIEPILATLPDERQKLRRYYGVHPYFTRRSANVIQSYIRRFSQPNDIVIDPYGGSGVTAIEALLLGRKAVHNDLNPFANFITRVVGDTTLDRVSPLRDAFQTVESKCRTRLQELETAPLSQIESLLKRLPLPANIELPKNSDARCYYDLFTPRQLAALAILKKEIDGHPRHAVRDALLLAWSATVAKLNKTFISTKGRAESRGGSSIFSLYRYKLARNVIELPLWDTFTNRFRNIVAAKEEVIAARDHYNTVRKNEEIAVDSKQNLTVLQKDAAQLDRILGPESADYIFTDPPYGGHIAYLDLSILWNHWMGFKVSDRMRQDEVIVGGEFRLTKNHYKRKLAESIRACLRLLKPDRWFSIVFQHWDVSYFQTILDTATGNGAELRAAVTQEREVIWSMHKKKNAENMLAGEMILTFYKPAGAHAVSIQVRESKTQLLHVMLDAVLTEECAQNDELTSQFLFNKLILRAWRSHSLSELAVSRREFVEALRQRGWEYDATRHIWRRAVASRQSDLFVSAQTP
jgi:adenine-specific DNA methylase